MFKTMDQNYWHLLQENNTARNQFNALKRHLDLGTHAQAFHAFKDILSITFTNYQFTAAAFNLSASLILDAGVQTVKNALFYLFMAKIFLNYSPAVYNLLSDTPQSLNHIQ
jgi:hypothetical protein